MDAFGVDDYLNRFFMLPINLLQETTTKRLYKAFSNFFNAEYAGSHPSLIMLAQKFPLNFKLMLVLLLNMQKFLDEIMESISAKLWAMS